MTEVEIKEMLPIFEALGNDKEVEAFCGGKWQTLPNFPGLFRIKPKEFWIFNNNVVCSTEKEAIDIKKIHGGDIIHVQEVPL